MDCDILDWGIHAALYKDYVESIHVHIASNGTSKFLFALYTYWCIYIMLITRCQYITINILLFISYL